MVLFSQFEVMNEKFMAKWKVGCQFSTFFLPKGEKDSITSKRRGVEFAKQQVQPTLYSYGVLKLAIRNFHKDNELGKGGFGVVYKVSSLTVWPFIIDIKTFICCKLHLIMSNETLFDFSNWFAFFLDIV